MLSSISVGRRWRPGTSWSAATSSSVSSAPHGSRSACWPASAARHDHGEQRRGLALRRSPPTGLPVSRGRRTRRDVVAGWRPRRACRVAVGRAGGRLAISARPGRQRPRAGALDRVLPDLYRAMRRAPASSRSTGGAEHVEVLADVGSSMPARPRRRRGRARRRGHPVGGDVGEVADGWPPLAERGSHRPRRCRRGGPQTRRGWSRGPGACRSRPSSSCISAKAWSSSKAAGVDHPAVVGVAAKSADERQWQNGAAGGASRQPARGGGGRRGATRSGVSAVQRAVSASSTSARRASTASATTFTLAGEPRCASLRWGHGLSGRWGLDGDLRLGRHPLGLRLPSELARRVAGGRAHPPRRAGGRDRRPARRGGALLGHDDHPGERHPRGHPRRGVRRAGPRRGRGGAGGGRGPAPRLLDAAHPPRPRRHAGPRRAGNGGLAIGLLSNTHWPRPSTSTSSPGTAWPGSSTPASTRASCPT